MFANMPRYETYRSNAAEIPIMRKWVLRALLLSLALHGALFLFFYFKKLESFAVVDVPAPRPPVFQIQQRQIPEELLEEEDLRIDLVSKPVNSKIQVPVEKPEPKEIEMKPSTTEIASPLLTDKPKAPAFDWQNLAKTDAISAGAADKELGAIATALLKDSVKAKNQPVIKLNRPNKDGDGGGGLEGIPGRQTVEEALGKIGETGATDKPVAMPGGALFEHDKWELAGKAQDDLQQLADLLARYPDATFVISGHTDYTGTPEYNLRLSERRAEAVKEWLIQKMGIESARIQTLGKANSEPIKGIEPEMSIDEQAPMRRVEIVIKTNRR